MKVYFLPKPSIIINKYEFNTRCHKEEEKVATFVAALGKIAEHCNYGDALNDMLMIAFLWYYECVCNEVYYMKQDLPAQKL